MLFFFSMSISFLNAVCHFCMDKPRNKIFIYSAPLYKERQVLAEPETGGGSKMGFGRMEYYPMDLDRH